MRRSSKGNPYHDEKGRFTSASNCSVKSELSNYDIRNTYRTALNNPTKENAELYLSELKKDKDYQTALSKCDKKADKYNKKAQELEEKMVAYNEAIDLGKKPNCNYEDLIKESNAVRKLFEDYKTSDLETSKYEKDLRKINNELAKAEGQNPAFYKGVIPRKNLTMVVMPYERPHKQKGFSEDVLNHKSKEFQMTIIEASALRGESKKETEQRFKTLLGKKKPTVDNYKKIFEKLYKEKQGELLALDIETNSLSPAQGNIIEFGCVSSTGEEFNSLYSPTKEQLDTNGVGVTEVHHISKSMIKNRKTFEEDRENILNKMKGKTIVVHNKGFELNWFRQQIPGFAEAEIKGEIRVVDTMHICQKFCDTDRNTLQKFVEFNGGEYKNAHRSSADAKMTLEALNKWLGK